ncbi:MAG: SLBB domain-containing protein [bacterium]|nr:SLBB domain-containing protein [bacterium]
MSVLLSILITVTPIPEDYKLQIRDEITLTVSGNINFAYSDSVSPQGTIFIRSGGLTSEGVSPLSNAVTLSSSVILGTVKVLDLTLEEASKLVEDEFNRYFKNIRISIAIKGFHDVICVNGAVEKPGAYPFFPGRTAKEYIGLAGGFTERADAKRSYVIKKGGNKIHIDKTEIDRGDIIVVKRVFLKWWEDYVTIASALTTVTIAWFTLSR